MKGQLRISRVKRPRATLLAILMLAGAYCSLGLWVNDQKLVDGNSHLQVAQEQVVQQIDNKIEQLSQRIASAIQKPRVDIIRIVHGL